MNKCTSEVENVNKSCLCKTLDKEVLFKVLGDSPLLKDLIRERPNLFSNVAIFLSQEEVKQIQNTIFAIEEIIQSPTFQKKVLENTSEVARMDFGTKGVFMGYDFHLTEDGPKLIEINTNAGGAFLNLILAKAQHSCCSGAVFPIELDKVQDSLFDIFMKEWRLQRKDQSLKVIAIMDENPTEQYLYPEFELFSKLFKEKGINIFILDPRLIEHKEGALWFENTKIDLIYNRSTDFYFENGVYSKIRDAYLGNEVVITPNPHHHALYADKENLEIFTSVNELDSLKVSTKTKELLLKGIPRTIKMTEANRSDLWSQRRDYFFKPSKGYGSKATYRGDKLTHKVWEEMRLSRYVAQRLALPGIRIIEKDGKELELKQDIRAYSYDGEVILFASRLYSGQTTNFRTTGGGFAAVFVI